MTSSGFRVSVILSVVVALLLWMNGQSEPQQDSDTLTRQQRGEGHRAETFVVPAESSGRSNNDVSPGQATVGKTSRQLSVSGQRPLASISPGYDTSTKFTETVREQSETLDPDTLTERRRQLVESLDEGPWDSSLPLFLDEVRLLISSYASGRRYSEALMLLDQIERRAKSSAGFASIQESLTELRSSLETRRERFAALVDAEQTLAIFPDDADAHLAVGLWLILERDGWDQAVVHLAKSGETSLWLEPAALDLAAESDARAIAVAWWHLGSRLAQIDPFRQKLLLRSRYWERQASEAAAWATR